MEIIKSNKPTRGMPLNNIPYHRKHLVSISHLQSSKAQPTFKSVCQSENDTPLVTKHVELTTLQNTSITVPEPVFTIQLDMHVPEVRDSPDAEILENLHGVPNNEDEYPNLQLSVNINSQHLPILLSEPEPSYLPPQDNHFQFNHPPDNEDNNGYY